MIFPSLNAGVLQLWTIVPDDKFINFWLAALTYFWFGLTSSRESIFPALKYMKPKSRFAVTHVLY